MIDQLGPLAGEPFLKMNGLGNDFVVLDLRAKEARVTSEAARAIADREDGVGCDQVITIEGDGTPFMGVWNADGSEVGACGNAARCVGLLLMEESGMAHVQFTTRAGRLSASRAGRGRISVDMGRPRFKWDEIPLAEEVQDTRFVDVKLGPVDAPVLWGPSAVSMGNPHCIFFVEDVAAHAIDRFGPLIEHHPMFPEGVNVSIAAVRGPQLLRLRVWERGAGVTKACGTAACAAVVAAVRRRLIERNASVELDGGVLAIEWGPDDHVLMTGPATLDFEGVLPGGD